MEKRCSETQTVSGENPRSARDGTGKPEICCSRCHRSAEELERMNQHLFVCVDKHGENYLLCSICSTGW